MIVAASESLTVDAGVDAIISARGQAKVDSVKARTGQVRFTAEDGILRTGLGTTFTMELPLFKDHNLCKLDRAPESSVYDRISTKGSTRRSDRDLSSILECAVEETAPRFVLPKRILVVDDASSNRKMLIRILTSNGYVCEQAEDGQQAIDRYVAALQTDVHFDAIVMDFEMPVMNGPTATKRLREMGCQVPVLGVTGNLLPEDVKFFKEHGADQVFGKPLNLTRFEEFMRDHSVGRTGGGSLCSSNSQQEQHRRPPRGKSIDSKFSATGSTSGSGVYSFTLSVDSADLSGVDLV